jgi:hypothetical protein
MFLEVSPTRALLLSAWCCSQHGKYNVSYYLSVCSAALARRAKRARISCMQPQRCIIALNGEMPSTAYSDQANGPAVSET